MIYENSQQALENNQDKTTYKWLSHDIHIYNVLKRKEMLFENEKYTPAKKKSIEIQKDIKEMSLSELNKLSIEITKEYIKSNPNTWEKLVSKDKKYKEVCKRIKELKS